MKTGFYITLARDPRSQTVERFKDGPTTRTFVAFELAGRRRFVYSHPGHDVKTPLSMEAFGKINADVLKGIPDPEILVVDQKGRAYQDRPQNKNLTSDRAKEMARKSAEVRRAKKKNKEEVAA